jgi:hypothetical protein
VVDAGDRDGSLPRGAGIHPRPMLRRAVWWSLDGPWDCALETQPVWHTPADVAWNGTIEVPFAPETMRSGRAHSGYLHGCWYRRRVRLPPNDDDRMLLHFGAVDHRATVWADGRPIARHEGGYTPFHVDVTDLADGDEHEIVVLAEDDPMDLAKPRGKQDWEPTPHSIWYHRTTGIWQRVWLERVGRTHVRHIHWRTNLDRLEVIADVRLSGPVHPGLRLHVVLRSGDRLLVDDEIALVSTSSRIVRGFRLDATGIDHLRESLFWTPEHPSLVDAVVELRDGDRVVDSVESYTAIRDVALADGRFLLNGRPYPLRLVLDQGYWHESGLTPPDDDALRRDVELAKELGFNGVRKHQKIEDPRYLWWADRLGLLLWVEMPPAYQFDTVAVRRVVDEWTEVVERDRSHPCIVAWVPFNESTGVLSLPTRAEQRHFVSGLAHLTKALDPSRPVVSNDGWETVGGDLICVHDYEQDALRLLERWSGDLRDPVVGFGAHGRRQTLDEDPSTWRDGRPARPIVLSEVGGIGWHPEAPLDREEDHRDNSMEEHPDDRLAQPASWGYSTVAGPDELLERYRELMDALHALYPRIAGFCYTQFADTYQEVNGLLRADRTPKVPTADISAATVGPRPSFHDPLVLGGWPH